MVNQAVLAAAKHRAWLMDMERDHPMLYDCYCRLQESIIPKPFFFIIPECMHEMAVRAGIEPATG